jgi:putative hydrolase of the HAD superfamily
MLGRKQRYNRDLWWKILLKDFHLKRLSSRSIYDVTLQYWNSYANAAKPFSDAESTVRRLKKDGYKVAVVSDTDGTLGMKRSRFKHVPFHKLFKTLVVAGEDTPRVKPGHESFLLVARRLGVNPRECVYVGDNPRTDIAGAKAVGMTTVIVRRRGNEHGKPAYRIDSLRAILRLLRSIEHGY